MPTSKIGFKLKYWKRLKNMEDPVAIHLIYMHVHYNIVNGWFSCTEAQALRLASYELQASYGDYNPALHKPGFLDVIGLSQFLPPEYRPSENLSLSHHTQARLFAMHSQYRGISKQEAEQRYIEIAEQLPTYGITFFKVTHETNGPLYLGIAEEGAYTFSLAQREMMDFYPFSQLKGWAGIKTAGGSLFRGVQLQKSEGSDTNNHNEHNDSDSDSDDEKEPKAKFDGVEFTSSHQQACTIIELLNGYCCLLANSTAKWMRATPKVSTLSRVPPDLPSPSLFTAPRRREFSRGIPSLLDAFKPIYINACAKEGISPLPKITMQVDMAIDSNRWLEVLDISSCMIDDRSLDVLLSSLLRALSTNSSPNATTSTDASLSTLVSINSLSIYGSTSAYQNLRLNTIDLSNNPIDEKSCSVLQNYISNSAFALRQVILANCKLGNKILPTLSSRLALMSCLEVLNLASNEIPSIEPLCKEDFKTLHTIILRQNKLGDKGAPQIADFATKTPTLTSLDISYNKIGDSGIEVIARSLKPHKGISHLDCSGNIFTTKGANAIANLLVYTKSLKSIQICSGKLTHESASILAEAIKINETLTSLGLRDNTLGKVGASALAQSLKSNRTLLDLSLDQNSLDSTSITPFMNVLADNRSLTSLSLRSNVIGKNLETPCLLFSDFLSKNKYLLNLDLYSNLLGPTAMLSVSEGLSNNESLVFLSLEGNKLDGDSVHELTKALNYNNTLVSLKLDNTQLADDTIYVLASTLEYNQALTSLSLSQNMIGDTGVLYVLEALGRRTTNFIMKKIDLTQNKIQEKDALHKRCLELKLNTNVLL
eukprot:TRINITY_DN3279_c0_g2_i1.p1 TRINITY_DN3279_c0_g2~~TRINITY_DN3279_c0_g2_i1.p1  ORF type:complete len:824 (+),score=138.28 TRINITY_DN3279_c0_g2_i1:170-2641(+)